MTPAHDPIEALLRLRRIAVDDTRRALAECLRAEESADRSVDALVAQIARETRVAEDLATSDSDVEAFAMWLGRIRPTLAAAHQARDEARLATVQARGLVAAARAASRAAEQMLQRHDATRRVSAERQDQRFIDEVADRGKRRSRHQVRGAKTGGAE